MQNYWTELGKEMLTGPNTGKCFPPNNQSDFRIGGPKRHIWHGHMIICGIDAITDKY